MIPVVPLLMILSMPSGSGLTALGKTWVGVGVGVGVYVFSSQEPVGIGVGVSTGVGVVSVTGLEKANDAPKFVTLRRMTPEVRRMPIFVRRFILSPRWLGRRRRQETRVQLTATSATVSYSYLAL